jgi:hypothetical protein
MKIAYIAHQIGGDVNGNTKKVIAIVRAINLTEPETIPFAPYISDVMALNDEIPDERARGFKNNKHYFQKGIIDELRLYGPVVSAGMIEEIRWARLYDIPIINNITEGKEELDALIFNRSLLFEKILTSVLRTFEITEATLKSTSRKRPVVMARQIFVGLCLEIIPNDLNTVSLGAFLNRDHSTIVYSRETCNDLKETNAIFLSFYSRVKILINLP